MTINSDSPVPISVTKLIETYRVDPSILLRMVEKGYLVQKGTHNAIKMYEWNKKHMDKFELDEGLMFYKYCTQRTKEIKLENDKKKSPGKNDQVKAKTNKVVKNMPVKPLESTGIHFSGDQLEFIGVREVVGDVRFNHVVKIIDVASVKFVTDKKNKQLDIICTNIEGKTISEFNIDLENGIYLEQRDKQGTNELIINL